jgi:carbon dioxide concentrating mechanism protein CcmN
MSLPPLRLSDNFDSYISGEVIIHPSAVIAPGVILQAGLKGKIIISSGVCIGTGSILQVHEGILEIGANANLGAGFLMVGAGKIGENACIGSATTIFNAFVSPGEVVAPGSILGENSRQIIKDQAIFPDPVTIEATDNPSASIEDKMSDKEEEVVGKEDENSTTTRDSSVESKDKPPTEEAQEFSGASETANNIGKNNIGEDNINKDNISENNIGKNNIGANNISPNNVGAHIYGQRNIQHLLVTLFPHRQTLNKSPTDEESK